MEDNLYDEITEENNKNGFNTKKFSTKLEEKIFKSNGNPRRTIHGPAKGNTYEVFTTATNSVGSMKTASNSPLYECLKKEQNLYDTAEDRNNCNCCKEDVPQRNVRKYWLFFFMGVAIGAIIASLVVFFVMMYTNRQPNKNNRQQELTGNSTSRILTRLSDCSKTCGKGSPQTLKQPVDSAKLRDNTTNETETYKNYRISDNEDFIDMKFNQSTLHFSRYLSTDNTVLGNQETSLTPKRNSFGTLKRYTGVMADRCFKKSMRIYYQVEYNFTINTALTATNLILEIGLAQMDQVDNNDFVGNENKGWSFVLARCGVSDNVCLRAKHYRKLEFNRDISKNVVGLTKSGIFDVFIDRTRNLFSLKMDNYTYSFKNVTSNFELCPVFGVHHKGKTNVTLRIMKTRNLTRIPFEL